MKIGEIVQILRKDDCLKEDCPSDPGLWKTVVTVPSDALVILGGVVVCTSGICWGKAFS
ncbi:hypothetical protein PIB30_115620, partial [Stylosanthes scabra]|nr:hypothetical protein [Stylosanthes scabra]